MNILCIAVCVIFLTFQTRGVVGINPHTQDSEHKAEPEKRINILRKARHAPYGEPHISLDSQADMCYIKHPSKEPYDCPKVRHNRRISTDTNGNKYLNYRRKNYSFVDIQAWFNQPKEKRGQRISKIPCCSLSYVANLLNMCPGSEVYACYTDDTVQSYTVTPRCGPPKIECKCYQSNMPICEEDGLPWCNSHTNGEQCRHKTVTDGGVHLRCICNTTKEDVPELTECSTRSAPAAEMTTHHISRDSPNKDCSIELPSSKEPLQCENTQRNNYNQYIKNSNGEVYLEYRENDYYYEDIKALIQQSNENKDSRFNSISCCLLSYVANVMSMCPGSEEYACYTDTADNYSRTPQCGPPKMKFGCKCYQSRIPICAEDKLPWCHDHTNSTECRHETVTDGGANLRCICNTTQRNDPESTSCSKLSALDDKNDGYKDYRRHS